MTYMQQPPQGYYPAPAPRPAPRSAPAYIGLGFIGWLLRLIGWFMFIIGIVLFVGALVGVAAIHERDLPTQFQGAPMTLVNILPGIVAVISGLFVVGFGEVYLALRDMARNSFK